MTSPDRPAPPGPPPPPLLLVCALGVERRALRGGGLSAAPGAVGVLRTGMGPVAAARSVGRALAGLPGPADPPGRPAGPGGARAGTAVLATGFCAGLAPGMKPGDVMVATEVRGTWGICVGAGSARPAAGGLPAVDGAAAASAAAGADAPGAAPVTAGARACALFGSGGSAPAVAVPGPAVDRLVGALRGHGVTVHTGALASCDHIVRGRERAALHARGCAAADMESAAVLHAALASGNRPVAAVRVIVDTPEYELLRLTTFRTGMTAFRALRSVVPAFLDWQRTLAGTASAYAPDPSPTPHVPLFREVG